MFFQWRVARVGQHRNSRRVIWDGAVENPQTAAVASVSTRRSLASATVGASRAFGLENLRLAIGGFQSASPGTGLSFYRLLGRRDSAHQAPTLPPLSANTQFRVPTNESRNGKTFERP